ncbi:TonB-dependent receptor [Parabacteroides sp. TM07-1AC]|uniref:TonB-dependent receptor n=1 Tax=Parabacteroides sp. TM07-1AC TaxID=2292363 RepID=UPI000EFE4812|nr:outer membrane beta-barrel protein [Parabacteroides sp. TM07-1AC]RHU23238.1 TonB-dependent receptor [Parabacteroides sp. TM07-1AC]
MKRYIFTVLGTLISVFAFSQKIEIKGKILDTEKQILEGASIALYKQDTILVTGGISDVKGVFRLKNITPDTYKVVISFVGFIPENIKLYNLKQNIDLENILLQSDTELKEVVVTASNRRYEVNRQIIIPTKSIMDISNNGWNLMRNMQLSRIQINPINNEITTDNGENVILQINGIQVEKEEIMTLDSKNIIRIEYLDQPGVRYQAGAVINYIVKQREQGGYFMANGNQTLSKNGINQYTLAGNYNWNKSQLGIIFDYNQSHVKWTRENEYNYIFPNEEITRIESGVPTLYNDKTLKASIKYSLSDADKYFFSATLRNNFNDVPNQFSDRQGHAISSNTNKKTFFQDFSTWKENAPSLDLYYQHNLKNKQLLIFNVVGTYIDSKSKHNYFESIDNISISDINSIIDGEKYSIIAEGIYEKDFQQKGKLSVGIRHNQSRTENEYSGDILSKINLNYSESYLFAEYNYSKNQFSLNTGLSGKYTYYKQGDEDYKKLNPQPRLLLQYSLNKNMVLRYRLNIASSSPSLSDLNDVEQEIDTWQIRQGNPSLKNSTNYSQSLMYSYNNKYIGIEFRGTYTYLDNPISETIFTENNRIINTIENHKNWQHIQIQSTFNIRPFGQYISLQIRPRFSRYIMNGNNYTHTYNNLSLYATLVASYERWFLNAQMETRYNTLMGETIAYGQNFHMVGAGYNAEKWNISAGLYLPFSKNYSQAIRNLSNVASSYSNVHTKDFRALVYIAASINLDFGKVKQNNHQRINNQDSGSSILQSGKISM